MRDLKQFGQKSLTKTSREKGEANLSLRYNSTKRNYKQQPLNLLEDRMNASKGRNQQKKDPNKLQNSSIVRNHAYLASSNTQGLQKEDFSS